MHRSSVVFCALAIFFAIGAIFFGWKAYIYEPSPQLPRVEGAKVPLGLGGEIDGERKALIPARSAVLIDGSDMSIKYEQEAFVRVPIASITKLMTAMVALDYGLDWDAPADILPKEYVEGGQLLLHPGETATVRDLFNASLLGSANNATLAYVRSLGIENDEFVRAMNRKAVELELEQTEFEDVTGLNTRNISTAYEVAKMAVMAFGQYPEIAEATRQEEYYFVVGGSGREHTIKNTNKLISENNWQASGSKTGFLYEAGYCLVMQGADDISNRLGVVLGSESEAQHFAAMEKLLQMPIP